MEANTLMNNKINQFILRIDLSKDSDINIRKLAMSLQKDYERLVETSEHNFHVNMETNKVTQRDFINYVLYADNGNIQVTLNTLQKLIIFESKTYVDSNIYVARLEAIVEKINAQNVQNVMSSRIGMRYINLFPCDKKEYIKKILQKPNDKAIIDSLSKDGLNRSVFVEQFNCDEYYIRVQYGVFNKFYPAPIKNLDITLDIDVYYGGLTPIADWTEKIRTYNHAAYSKFTEYVESDYIETMRNE